MVNRLKDRRSPDNFCVTSLFKEKTHQEAAELVADFFCSIGENFSPLQETDLPPRNDDDDKLTVTTAQVEKRLRECKRPRGLLQGDLFPDLVGQYANKLAPVVANVLNCLLYTSPSPRDRQKSRMPSSA